MIEDRFKPSFLYPLAMVSFFLVISCASAPDVVGKWRETGNRATLELCEDGTFKAVDNLGMSASGRYTLHEKGSIRFEITRQGISSEIVNGKISVGDDELTITSADGKEVERYRKEN